ncbi:hypothetical protein EC988_004021 [Linderina pennispora]|nr:hypothetical protein EC988_004021 [Linderina pennispora]
MSVVSKSSATVRKKAHDRRTVFKHALEKPYATSWPDVDGDMQSAIVSDICATLSAHEETFQRARHAIKKEQDRARSAAKRASQLDKKWSRDQRAQLVKEGKLQKDIEQQIRSALEERRKARDKSIRSKRDELEVKNKHVRQMREILGQVVVGINKNTRVLEKMAAEGEGCTCKLGLVVVCRGDVDIQLVSHLQGLTHAAFVAVEGEPAADTDIAGLRMVGVGKGSEKQLALAIHQPRASVLGIKAGSELFKDLLAKVPKTLPPPVLAWVGGGERGLVKMAVREIRTTAPILNRGTKNKREETSDEGKQEAKDTKKRRLAKKKKKQLQKKKKRLARLKGEKTTSAPKPKEGDGK